MASDEIIWGIIDKQFCSYKLKAPSGQNFCHNEYNVTGLCSRQSCPLANSRYATVRANPETGRLYLYMKTVERAHLPSKLWERIRLSPNYAEALQQIDSRLLYWPKFSVHKCKQRLTRLTQVAMRMRRLAKEDERLGETLVAKRAPKVRHREKTRERKAEAAAQLERTIERTLLDRLRSGTYGHEPLNVSETIWKKVLSAMEREGGAVRDRDMDRGIEADREAMAAAGELQDDELDDNDNDDDEEEYEDEREQERERTRRTAAALKQSLKHGESGSGDDDADDLSGNVEYVSDFDESEDDLGDIEDWLGDDDDEDEDEDEDEDDEDDEDDDNDDAKNKKRKRGKVTRIKRPVKSLPKDKKLKMTIEYDAPRPSARAVRS